MYRREFLVRQFPKFDATRLARPDAGAGDLMRFAERSPLADKPLRDVGR